VARKKPPVTKRTDKEEEEEAEEEAGAGQSRKKKQAVRRPPLWKRYSDDAWGDDERSSHEERAAQTAFEKMKQLSPYQEKGPDFFMENTDLVDCVDHGADIVVETDGFAKYMAYVCYFEDQTIPALSADDEPKVAQDKQMLHEAYNNFLKCSARVRAVQRALFAQVAQMAHPELVIFNRYMNSTREMHCVQIDAIEETYALILVPGPDDRYSSDSTTLPRLTEPYKIIADENLAFALSMCHDIYWIATCIDNTVRAVVPPCTDDDGIDSFAALWSAVTDGNGGSVAAWTDRLAARNSWLCRQLHGIAHALRIADLASAPDESVAEAEAEKE
jgi:hypothetical protein